MTHKDVDKLTERVNATLEATCSSAAQMCDRVVDILAPCRQVILCTNDGAEAMPIPAQRVGIETTIK